MMIYIWLGLFILTLIVEIGVPAIVSIWFSAGSLVAFVLAAFLGDTLIWLQVLVFFAVSIATIILLRPLILSKKEKQKTNIDALIGKVGKCVKDIEPFSLGEVKLNGLTWNAQLVSDTNESIKEGSLVEIKEIQGNKLKVEKYKEE